MVFLAWRLIIANASRSEEGCPIQIQKFLAPHKNKRNVWQHPPAIIIKVRRYPCKSMWNYLEYLVKLGLGPVSEFPQKLVKIGKVPAANSEITCFLNHTLPKFFVFWLLNVKSE